MRRLVFCAPLLALMLMVAAACEQVLDPADDPAVQSVFNATYAQTDRFGLPAIATVFIPSNRKDEFNQAAPAGDQAAFRTNVVETLIAFGNDAATANALADALLPDVQPIDVSQPSGFLNGRRPQDDVITAELGLIFGANAALNDDHVDANDVAFLPVFPYLAGPHLP